MAHFVITGLILEIKHSTQHMHTWTQNYPVFLVKEQRNKKQLLSSFKEDGQNTKKEANICKIYCQLDCRFTGSGGDLP